MSKTLLLKTGKTEIVFNAKDFEELIDDKMGFEAAKHYHQQIEQLSECIRDLAYYVNDPQVQQDIEEVLSINGYE